MIITSNVSFSNIMYRLCSLNTSYHALSLFFVRSHFGEEVMGVEQGKKENRSEYGFYLTMKEFLDVS